MDMRARATVAGLALCSWSWMAQPSAQSDARRYVISLPSASVYDTRSGDEDSVHVFLSVFVNGMSRGIAIWDGMGSDGTRPIGRAWTAGLHLLGSSSQPTVQVSTGPVQPADAVQIVFQILNAGSAPTRAQYEATADRLRLSACAGGDDGSAWSCLRPLAADLLDGLSLTGCDGVLAADKLVYTGTQLEVKTSAGKTATVSSNYGGANAPAGCGQSIYGARITIARQ
jgi:hypothetical protein